MKCLLSDAGADFKTFRLTSPELLRRQFFDPERGLKVVSGQWCVPSLSLPVVLVSWVPKPCCALTFYSERLIGSVQCKALPQLSPGTGDTEQNRIYCCFIIWGLIIKTAILKWHSIRDLSINVKFLFISHWTQRKLILIFLDIRIFFNFYNKYFINHKNL